MTRSPSIPTELHATTPEALPFAPSLHIRCYLLKRDAGNLLVYNAPLGSRDVAVLEELGRATRQYLGHRHEAGFGEGLADVPLICHEAERDAVADSRLVAETFSERTRLDDDLEIIPIPGHTSGSTAYLWERDGRRYLFTADTIYLSKGEWVGAVLGSSDREAYIASLETLRELAFDVLVPWAATAGQSPMAETDEADARRRVDAILDRLRRGEDR